MLLRAAFAFLSAMLLVAVGAGADDLCRTSRPEVDTGPEASSLGGPRFYVDNDWCDCAFSIWVYQESNGVDGLQRDDEDKDDTHGGQCYAGDTIIF